MNTKEEEKIRLLFELIKGSRRSDRELAKTMRLSQPTITRKRTLLEKEGYILEYTALPNLSKIGYEFVAFTFLSFTENTPELFQKAREWTKKNPTVVFAADGEGAGMNSIMISVHKQYASFAHLITKLRQDWQPNLRDAWSFIVSLERSEAIIRQFSFRYLESNE